jgi:hypothetical protein
MKNVFGSASAAWLILFSMQAPAQPSARELLDKARGYVAAAPAIRRIDTSEQSAVFIVGESRMEQQPQTNVVTVEIDMSKHLARQTTTIQDQPFVMLKQGEKAAMKLGSGPWEIPRGPYENLAKDMGNLFVCETETPETKESGIVWKLAGTVLLDGQEAYVIETDKNSGVALAQARMTKGMAKYFSGSPAGQPAIKVLEYSSKHWISKSDYRRLQAVQISKTLVMLPLPGGKEQQVEQSIKATSRYSYGKVAIEIPEEARKVLAIKQNAK